MARLEGHSQVALGYDYTASLSRHVVQWVAWKMSSLTLNSMLSNQNNQNKLAGFTVNHGTRLSKTFWTKGYQLFFDVYWNVDPDDSVSKLFVWSVGTQASPDKGISFKKTSIVSSNWTAWDWLRCLPTKMAEETTKHQNGSCLGAWKNPHFSKLCLNSLGNHPAPLWIEASRVFSWECKVTPHSYPANK